MNEPAALLSQPPDITKTSDFIVPPNTQLSLRPKNPNSLTGWISLYYHLSVKASSIKTQQSKSQDLNKFIRFYHDKTQSDNINYWILPITQQFQDYLKCQTSPITNQVYKATTINRIMATIKHFAKWLLTRHPLVDGDPATNVKFLTVDEPDWHGLKDEQIQAIEQVCQHRLKHCNHKFQNPELEAAIFYCLLHTGLRETELININKNQYYNAGFNNVGRKNKIITSFVPLPSTAIKYLDDYLKTRVNQPDEINNPLFLSKFNNRLSARNVRRICERLAKQANQYLLQENFHFSPHQLRHTFLKRMTDKYGIHFAHRVSGNISVKEIFRYAKPSRDEIKQCVESLFD
jgi:integrase/recombinase XerD